MKLIGTSDTRQTTGAWADALLPGLGMELEKRGLAAVDAARLLLELADEAGRARVRGASLVRRCREVIRLGGEACAASRRSVGFARAVESSLKERAERRPRTVREIRNICERLLRGVPGLPGRRLREITPAMCRSMLEAVFPTVRQRAKARLILHGVFEHGMRQGWCSENPVAALPAPRLSEAEVRPLPWETLQRLLRTARKAEHRSCMAALGVMLWAGVRPAEVERLGWGDIDWEEGVISVRPRHSKTGGARHITLQPVLAAWLREAGVRESGPLCPPDWVRRWRALREAAGAMPWQQDVLRHTFASYFIKQWHSYEKLQVEMGHRSARLLRTRYLSMSGVTREQAAAFWKVRPTPSRAGKGVGHRSSATSHPQE